MMWARSTSWRLVAGREVAGGQPLLEGLIDLDDGATGENRGALDHILQFPTLPDQE